MSAARASSQKAALLFAEPAVPAAGRAWAANVSEKSLGVQVLAVSPAAWRAMCNTADKPAPQNGLPVAAFSPSQLTAALKSALQEDALS